MTSRSKEKGAAVRARIEAAAIELIAERGWGAVSTRQLAERAGVTAGLVHYHYRSLDDALRTAVLGAAQTMMDEFVGTIGGAPDLEQAVARLWAGLDRHPSDEPGSVLIIEAMLAALRDPEMRTALTVVLHRFRRALADRLRQAGIADPEATAAVLAAALDGVMLHRMLSTDDLGADAVQPVMSRLLTNDLDPHDEELS